MFIIVYNMTCWPKREKMLAFKFFSNWNIFWIAFPVWCLTVLSLSQDDMIDDVEEFVAAAEILKERGAYKIYIMATHGLLSADAPRLIEESAIDEVKSCWLMLDQVTFLLRKWKNIVNQYSGLYWECVRFVIYPSIFSNAESVILCMHVLHGYLVSWLMSQVWS